MEGITLCKSVLPDVSKFAGPIELAYERIAVQRQNGDVASLFQAGERFVPTSSSFTIGAVFSALEVRELPGSATSGIAGSWIRKELGDQVVCDLDQSWIRRQYAPAHYPRFHSPHGWHQDGALGFDFLAHPDGRHPPDAVLRMVTCWIALCPCGEDAPGLELIRRNVEGLLNPQDLSDEKVRGRFDDTDFYRPVLGAGDALLFRGDILHRTYHTPGMTGDRTSIELRFFRADELPARLRNDRFI